jgi:predicted secreted hydrolase
VRRIGGVALVAVLVAGCAGGPILANDPIVYPSPPAPSAAPPRPADPIRIALPRDDGPHDRLTEWWYYTGHLTATNGRRFGFEAVVFRAGRGSVPVAWASHVALTDEGIRGRPGAFGGPGDQFHYAQRSEVGPQVDRSPRDGDGLPTGFDLQIAGLNPDLIAAGARPVAAPWRLIGSGGTDRIEAALSPEEAAAAGADFGLALDLSATKPVALHDGDGFVDFGPAGSSYYYSRTRLEATGQVSLNGETIDVTGIAWFDHQWGDFISVGGGWDWFAINLDDGTDITISLVRGPAFKSLLYGTVVDAEGNTRHLTGGDFTARASAVWVSEATGRRYLMAWRIQIPELRPGVQLAVDLTPTVADQELDTRATTGVIYWEGSQVVVGSYLVRTPTSVERQDVGGEAYVEITRYTEDG